MGFGILVGQETKGELRTIAGPTKDMAGLIKQYRDIVGAGGLVDEKQLDFVELVKSNSGTFRKRSFASVAALRAAAAVPAAKNAKKSKS